GFKPSLIPRQEDDRTPRDKAAGDDREATHMGDGHTQEPTIIVVPAQIMRARGGRRAEGSATQHYGFRFARGPGGVKDRETRFIVDRQRRNELRLWIDVWKIDILPHFIKD